jgi:CTP synthase
MRLGLYPCVIRKGSLAEKVYGDKVSDTNTVYERHRHRFEFNPLYREEMEKK